MAEYKYKIVVYREGFMAMLDDVYFVDEYLIKDDWLSLIGRYNSKEADKKLWVINLREIDSFSINGEKKWIKNLKLESMNQ